MRNPRSLLAVTGMCLTLIVLAALTGCGENEDGLCGEIDFNGFVETDEEGNILSGDDLGHWCLSGDEIPPTEPTFGPSYPNPFCNATSLQFTLPETSDVKIQVYNRRCQVIKTLVDGRLPAGRHVVAWDGTDFSGGHVADGFYGAIIEVGVDWDCWGVLYAFCASEE